MLVQCRYNMKRILIVLFCLVSLVSKGQVYQEMPQYGYRANRMAFDSTLQIPTVCGVPTLKSNVTKKAAIAFDSCNNKFYKYNPKTLTWSEISGGGTIPNLQQVTDSGNTTTNDIYAQNVFTNYGTAITDDGQVITEVVTFRPDITDNTKRIFLAPRIDLPISAYVLNLPNPTTNYQVLALSVNGNYADSTGDISVPTIDTTSLSNRINLKLNISDTTNMLSSYFNAINYGLTKSSQTVSVDTSKISTLYQTNLKVPYTGATQDVDLDIYKLSAQSLQVMGTGGNGHIDLKHQSANATATGQTTALFANSNGDLKWKNAGNYYTTLTTQQTADRAYTFQNKSYTLADSVDVANKVNISDTSTMLSKYLRKTDTSSLSSRIDTKLNSSDSSTYYTKYRSDTSRTNIYNALIGKQSSLTFSTGLTNTSGTITNNLSVGVSGGQTIIGGTAASNNLTLSTTSNATKGKIIFGTASAYDQANDRIGIGTTSPTNPLDVIRGGAGTMTRQTYESGSFVYNGDMKVGIYTASTNSTHGAAISFGQTNLTANSRYPGFDMQYVYSSTVASNAWRVNYTERSAAGVVQNYTANILQAYADGSVIINPTTSGVTASAKLLVGTATNAGYMLDVNGTARATQFYLSALNTAPASATATGTTGEIRIDANYIYICTATNTWKRVAIATW